jgi:hypothetical protein
MHVLISGSTGFIGTNLLRWLSDAGHRVRRLRRPATAGRPPYGAPAGTVSYWQPGENQIDPAGLEHMDAVIHLAGEPIADGRWTDEKRHRILASRVDGTQLLAEALAQCRHRPKVLLSASAIGYYGNRDDEVLTEDSMPGGGFLADTAREWEAATHAAADAGIRVANMRLGMVLWPTGGALAKLLPAFGMGLGGKFGPGNQYMSWISLIDALRAIEWLMTNPDAHGPYNLVSPQPVTNTEFTDTLGAVVNRPTWLDVPLFAIRAIFGEMADEVMLASQRVLPKRLESEGFSFGYPQLRGALEEMIKKNSEILLSR